MDTPYLSAPSRELPQQRYAPPSGGCSPSYRLRPRAGLVHARQHRLCHATWRGSCPLCPALHAGRLPVLCAADLRLAHPHCHRLLWQRQAQLPRCHGPLLPGLHLHRAGARCRCRGCLYAGVDALPRHYGAPVCPVPAEYGPPLPQPQHVCREPRCLPLLPRLDASAGQAGRCGQCRLSDSAHLFIYGAVGRGRAALPCPRRQSSHATPRGRQCLLPAGQDCLLPYGALR